MIPAQTIAIMLNICTLKKTLLPSVYAHARVVKESTGMEPISSALLLVLELTNSLTLSATQQVLQILRGPLQVKPHQQTPISAKQVAQPQNSTSTQTDLESLFVCQIATPTNQELLLDPVDTSTQRI
jgi:hypothetical protein